MDVGDNAVRDNHGELMMWRNNGYDVVDAEDYGRYRRYLAGKSGGKWRE